MQNTRTHGLQWLHLWQPFGHANPSRSTSSARHNCDHIWNVSGTGNSFRKDAGETLKDSLCLTNAPQHFSDNSSTLPLQRGLPGQCHPSASLLCIPAHAAFGKLSLSNSFDLPVNSTNSCTSSGMQHLHLGKSVRSSA